MPAAITTELTSEIERIVHSDAYRSKLEPLGVLATVISGGDLQTFQQNEVTKWGNAVRDAGVKNLTCVSNNAGIDGEGLGLLLETGQAKKMI